MPCSITYSSMPRCSYVVHTMDCIWQQCVHCAQLVHSGLISYVSVFVHDISHGSSAYTVLYQFSLPIHFMQQ